MSEDGGIHDRAAVPYRRETLTQKSDPCVRDKVMAEVIFSNVHEYFAWACHLGIVERPRGRPRNQQGRISAVAESVSRLCGRTRPRRGLERMTGRDTKVTIGHKQTGWSRARTRTGAQHEMRSD